MEFQASCFSPHGRHHVPMSSGLVSQGIKGKMRCAHCDLKACHLDRIQLAEGCLTTHPDPAVKDPTCLWECVGVAWIKSTLFFRFPGQLRPEKGKLTDELPWSGARYNIPVKMEFHINSEYFFLV